MPRNSRPSSLKRSHSPYSSLSSCSRMTNEETHELKFEQEFDKLSVKLRKELDAPNKLPAVSCCSRAAGRQNLEDRGMKSHRRSRPNSRTHRSNSRSQYVHPRSAPRTRRAGMYTPTPLKQDAVGCPCPYCPFNQTDHFRQPNRPRFTTETTSHQYETTQPFAPQYERNERPFSPAPLTNMKSSHSAYDSNCRCRSKSPAIHIRPPSRCSKSSCTTRNTAQATQRAAQSGQNSNVIEKTLVLDARELTALLSLLARGGMTNEASIRSQEETTLHVDKKTMTELLKLLGQSPNK